MTAYPSIHEIACWDGSEPKRSGDGYKMNCPHHKGDNFTATVNPGDTVGSAPKLVCYSSKCTYGQMASALRSMNLFPWNSPEWEEKQARKRTSKKRGNGVYAGHWDYFDPEAGRVTLRVKRLDYEGGGKECIPAIVDEAGIAVAKGGIKSWKPVLYNLPAVREAVKQERVIFDQEGEGKCDCVNQHGFVSSTAQGGSGNFKGWLACKPEIEYKGAAFVCVIPDNDKPGYKFALQKVRHLHKHGIPVKFLPLPGLGVITEDQGLDAKDWFNQHTAEELKQIATETAFWQPPPEENNESFDHVFEDGGLPAEANVVDIQKRQPRPAVPLDSETSNRDRLCEEQADNMLWIPEQQEWRLWDGGKYAPVENEAIIALAEKSADKIAEQLRGLVEPDRLERWNKQSHTRAKLENVVFLARSRCAKHMSEFDAQRFLLNTPNAVIDLRTLEPADRAKSMLLSNSTVVNWNPAAKCPQWLKFLDRIFAGNQDMIDFLQILMGYMITGETKEHKVLYFFGEGRNGKSTVLEFYLWMLGSYAAVVRKQMFMRTYQENSNDNLLFTRGKRFVKTSEIDRGDKLDQGKIKDFSGGEMLTSRILYDKKPQSWANHALLVLMGNHWATVQDQDHAIWSRLLPIQFPVVISDEEKYKFIRDHGKSLETALREEAEGIQFWTATGSFGYYSNDGLPEWPECIKETHKQYRNLMDYLGQFLEECCEIVTDEWQPATPLWRAFSRWLRNSGHNANSWNQTRFGNEMARRFEKDKSGRGNRVCYVGLRLKREWISTEGEEDDRDAS